MKAEIDLLTAVNYLVVRYFGGDETENDQFAGGSDSGTRRLKRAVLLLIYVKLTENRHPAERGGV